MSEETLQLKYLPFVHFDREGRHSEMSKFESGMDFYLRATSDIVYALPVVRR